MLDSSMMTTSVAASQLAANDAQQIRSLTDRGTQPMSGEFAEKMESMFATMLLKTMRQTLSEGGFFPGDSSDTLGSLFDQFMGDAIAEGRGLGLAQALDKYKQHTSETSPGELPK